MAVRGPDGLIEARRHTVTVKHRILKEWLKVWRLFKDRYRFNLIYIDAHAGTGKVRFGKEVRDGSPIIALKTLGRGNVRYFFIEKNSTAYLELKHNIGDFKGYDITVFKEDCNLAIPYILHTCYRKGDKAFCFLDPSGLFYRDEPQVNRDIIDELAYFGVEVMYNFPLNALLRCFRECKYDKLSRVVPDPIISDLKRGMDYRTICERLLSWMNRRFKWVVGGIVTLKSGAPFSLLMLASYASDDVKEIAEHIFRRENLKTPKLIMDDFL